MPVNTAAAERSKMEELSENEYDSEIDQDPPDELIMESESHDDSQDDGQDDDPDDGPDDGPEDGQVKRPSATMEQRGPVHERCVHGEINEIWVPLDRSEIFFSITQPYELQPLSRYFFREWSEAEHLFTSALQFAEDVISDWSPSRSPSPTSIGL